jgi:carbamoyltransferase
MIILGVNHFYHDTSACVVRDGQLVVALEEERLTREKHTWSFPRRSIARCLAEAGVAAGDVDHVAVSIQPSKDWHRKVLFGLGLGRRVGPFVRHELLRALNRQREFASWFRETFPGPRVPRLHQVSHHLAHIAGSFFVSPYERAALLSMDGSGEWSTTWLGETDGKTFRCFSESYFPHSLGSFYEAATEFCGFRANYDEGKTMGLAPFGDPGRFYGEMSRMVSVDSDGRVHVDPSSFLYQNWGGQRCGPKYYGLFGAPRRRSGPIEKHHEDVAAAAQRVLEDRVLEMCRILESRSSARHLVVSGGVALNSVMNGRILRETRFEDLYVMPAAGDNGTSIGAAYYVYNHVIGRTDRYHHSNPFVGPEYSNEVIEALLRECKLPHRRSGRVEADAAALLREGKIIGWFQGRMEIGPRALGNRSILADPTLPGMKDKINAEVKHREAYRPFAPSATAESRSRFFEIEVEAPFMLKVCQVRPEFKDKLPAITHVDGSARLQTVRRETNPRYHRLLEEFGALSGMPVVLNTSFNIMGEPIVESPVQAVRCFASTGLDALAIGDFIVTK